MKELVSVIMPNYNGKRFVADAINSVLNQTYKNLELIVIDDKSTDGSLSVIEDMAKRDGRIRVIASEKNCGVAETRNKGINFAVGDYIAFLDNDDLWVPEKLECQLNLARQGAELVYCSYDFIDEHSRTVKKPFIVPEKTDFKKMLSLNAIGCSAVFIKSDLLKKHKFDHTFYHEDYVLWMKILKEPIIARGDKRVLMHYRTMKGSRSNNKVNAAKKRWLIYRKELGLGRQNQKYVR